MKIQQIITFLQDWAAPAYQESYDNAQLICGDASASVRKILVSLDATEEVVDEAIRKGANLIIAHHPIVFKGLKKLTGSNYVERCIIKAIKHDIAIFAIHTNLDNISSGVNKEISNRLSLENTRILAPKTQILSKLITFVPIENAQAVAQAMFDAGAGQIGNYDMASFKSEGKGSFRPLKNANPHIGSENNYEEVKELKLEVLVENHVLSSVIQAMLEAHPYEEVAYDIIALQNAHPYVGSGMIGTLEKELSLADFLELLKAKFGVKALKYTGDLSRSVKTVALCGGSGIFLLQNAIRSKADVFLTSDVKYHEFFDAENKLSIVDIGHFESEQFTIDLILRKLQAHIDGIAMETSETKTNPVNYYV